MSIVFDDEFHGVGGSYEIRDGKRVRIEEPTADHPDGRRARYSDGSPVDEMATPAAAPTESTETQSLRRKNAQAE